MTKSVSTTQDVAASEKEHEMSVLDNQLNWLRSIVGLLVLACAGTIVGSVVGFKNSIDIALSEGVYEGTDDFFRILAVTLIVPVVFCSITSLVFAYLSFRQRELLAKRYYASK